MSRFLALFYGAACYAVFLATFLYAIAFVAGVGVPKHIDNGATAPWPTAMLTDIALLALFAVQHSVMARPAFKRAWTRLIPESAERSTYTLLSSLALILLFWQWSPLGGTVWEVRDPTARAALYAIYAFGWALLLYTTFLLNHFDLFGLRQVWRYSRGHEPDAGRPPFITRAFYRIVRHPLMLGFLIAFWATPTMTVGHLLFALATTGYILLAVHFLEERDLIAMYGDTYRDYQRRVPMILPWPKRARGAARIARPVP